jgi:hypothetical protein
MCHSVPIVGRLWSLVVTGALLAGALAGCADAPWPREGDDAVEKPPLPGSGTVAEFVAHVQPSRGTITLSRRPRSDEPARHGEPGSSPQSLTNLPLVQDGMPGSGPANTVELVTNTTGYDSQCPAGFQSNTWCANVTLEHFFGRSISNAFVQVTSITDLAGIPISGHGAVNSDAPQLGLDSSQGLWQYTAPGSTTAGVLGQSPDNKGSRDWVFANPDDADTLVTFRVVASLTYPGYGLVPSSAGAFPDGCSGPGTVHDLGSPAAFTPAQTLPFPFVVYDQVFTSLRILNRGVVTFGSAPGNVGATSVSLPSADVASSRPALFVFWDGLGFRSQGTLCTRATSDPPPNRRFIITWSDMDFAQNGPKDNPAHLRFSAVLSEGSNQIDLAYATMTGKTTRAQGAQATVGVQNATGTLATSSFRNPQFLSGTAFSLLPLP